MVKWLVLSGYDVIIVGGGHNGLVAAAYLGKAGLRTIVLERREFVGGACVTEELFPGFRFSSCSYVCHMLQDKVIQDLELRKYGFEIFQNDPTLFNLFPDGHHLPSWRDEKKTIKEIQRFSEHDAEVYPKWIDFWKKAAEIIHKYFLRTPPTLDDLTEDVKDTKKEEILNIMLTTDLRSFVEEYFESEQVRISKIPFTQDIGPRIQGGVLCLAYFKIGMLGDQKNSGLVKGGMGTITQAMARSAESRGVEIRTGVEVKQILVKNGYIEGVELMNGEKIQSQIVVSNADPKRTFLKLVENQHLDKSFIKQVEELKTNVAYLKFHASLSDLPNFSGFERSFDTYTINAAGEILICPSLDYYEKSWKDAMNGRPTRNPVMDIQIPTVYDDTLAPKGKHLMSIWSLYAPVKPSKGEWDDLKYEVGEHIIDSLSEYAPNIKKIIMNWKLFTPLDMERRVYLTDGNIRHIDSVTEQFLTRRPLLGWSNYRTPIQNLYLCGAGTHPGGEVTGAPGHNAAHVILEDFQRERNGR